MRSRRSIRVAGVLAVLAASCLSAGCGDSPPAPTDPSVSKQHLTAALDAWKSGGSQDELVNQTPPVRVIDRDWEKGAKVADYTIEGDGQPLGAGVQWPVSLTLANENGKQVKKRVVYVVNTGDVIAIARQDADF